MPLTLRLLTYRKEAPATPLERRFDRLGGTIGRAAGNDLELPDTARYISRNHARVAYADGHYTLTDLGANASWINDRPVGTGKTAALAHGDRILVGDYELEVLVDDGAPAVPLFAPQTSPAYPFQPQPVAAGTAAGTAAGMAAPAADIVRDTLAGTPILGGLPAVSLAESPAASSPTPLQARPDAGVLSAPSAADPLGLGLLAGGAAPRGPARSRGTPAAVR
jgi:type VI secretion system protein